MSPVGVDDAVFDAVDFVLDQARVEGLDLGAVLREDEVDGMEDVRDELLGREAVEPSVALLADSMREWSRSKAMMTSGMESRMRLSLFSALVFG